jgi:tRNA(fMet)-specific endonuclease VapC
MSRKAEEAYLLDTNILTAFYFQDAEITDRIRVISPERRFVPVIAVWEILHGCNKQVEIQRSLCLKGSPHSLLFALRDFSNNLLFLSRLQIAPYDEAAHHIYQSLPKQFRSNRRASDSMIAAIALANSLTLVTRNYQDFEDVPDLQLEDWRNE